MKLKKPIRNLMVDPSLIRAYRNTTYKIDAPGGSVLLRVGEANRALDAPLSRHGQKTCAFITAWNPGSQRLPLAENERRHEQLAREVVTRGYLTLPGHGVGDDGRWERMMIRTFRSVEECSTPSTSAEVSHDKVTPPTTMRGTMILPGETAAGSAGMQPYRGIAWWAHRDDHCICAHILPALLPTRIGSVDPHALKTTARRTESTLPENAPSHFTLRRHICSWRADSCA
jgi:Protein of unknown function (DUF3293)